MMQHLPSLPTFEGVPITFDPNCLKETKKRLFPESRHRSARIHKKLVKRFGGEFVMQPAMFKTPHGLWCHPALKADLVAALEAQ